jgi:hypothetical protein
MEGIRLMPAPAKQLVIPEIEAKDRVEYVMAGNCTFTVVSHKTGRSFTYKIQSAKADNADHWTTNHQDRTRFWVSLLTGPDNSSDFTYLCWIDARRWPPIIAAKNHRDQHVKNFKWVYFRILAGDYSKFDFLPSSQCGRCGRKLTTPDSITSGFGPECRGKI